MIHILSILLSTLMGTYAIQGVVVDQSSQEPVAFAQIELLSDSMKVAAGATDFDGSFVINPTHCNLCKFRITAPNYATLDTSISLRKDWTPLKFELVKE